ncbi:BZ3500_MvSof-1268-A1-R1_Chr5-3g08150 [Microbotryum saponariae]|uniref:BZ3500_MvSof-1268-A1-R1_Chr5-3g08150 protein n=1 Tax=Microbotryum saponariae TaxID=289078 RepID=A0A2X0LPM1_9BASI|nr:BZ3500_MvSof-1268-A1-R1_Chr5-3g08150 [Microbotryum saponariae]SDA07909.1 BZ3501_MvSof-1269-A2-R1_Chr5-1g07294 [Microbotryum saponariae]
MAGMCDFTCNSGFDKQGGTCVSTCNPYRCPEIPVSGVVFCNVEGACDFTCSLGSARQGDICVSTQTGCIPSGCIGTCRGNVCVMGCPNGYTNQNGVGNCVPIGSGCNVATCPTVPNSVSVCTVSGCDFVCNSRYTKLGGACFAIL